MKNDQSKSFIIRIIIFLIHLQIQINKMIYEVKENEDATEQLDFLIQNFNKSNNRVLYYTLNNSELFTVCESESEIEIRWLSLTERTQKQVTVSKKQQDDLHQIGYGFFDGGDAFLITSEPFQVFYIPNNQKEMIKLELAEEMALRNIIFTKLEDSIFIFGWKSDSKENYLCQLNLQTLAVKKIQHSKTYAPEVRRNQASLFCDDRLYVFGGTNLKNQECQKLNWVLDLEKGSWFGLQMDYPEEMATKKPVVIPWDHRKAFVKVDNCNKLWVYELHQSRLKEIIGNNLVNQDDSLIHFNGFLLSEDSNQLRFHGKRIVEMKKEKKANKKS